MLGGLGNIVAVDLSVRKALRDPQNRLIQQAWRGIFTEDTVTFECEDGTVTTVPWASIVKIEMFGHDCLLYPLKMNAIIVLRRFQTDEQWAQFSAWAARREAELA